jgi:hypothetical protein
MGKKSTFSRELPEKSTRGHTDVIFKIEPPICEETLCKIKKILKKPYFRYRRLRAVFEKKLRLCSQ